MTAAAHIPLIVELHAEDAAILWLQRDRAVDAPHYDREFLGRLDERLEANLDGLRIAGEAGWAEALRAFEAHREPGETFVLAALAFGRGRPAEVDLVLEAIAGDGTSALARAATSALGWLHPKALAGKVQPLLDDRRPAGRLLGLGACSVHRVDPRGQLAAFFDDEPAVRARAFRLAGELGRHDLLPRLAERLDDEDARCRFDAASAAALLGDTGRAVDCLRSIALSADPRRQAAFELAMRRAGFGAARSWLAGLGERPDAAALRVRGAGILGDLSAVPFLISRMEDPALGRIAGESFAMITGADLEYADLDGPAPDGAPQGPTDDPADPVVEIDADDELPWPDPGKVEAWWAAHPLSSGSGRRFVGRDWTREAFAEVFDAGCQRQRRAAAQNLALASPEAVLPNWRRREG